MMGRYMVGYGYQKKESHGCPYEEIRGPVMEMDGVIHGLHTALVPDMMGE